MRLTRLSGFEQFAPGVYDNSALQLTDLEREVLELRSQDREQEMVEQAAELVEPPEVSLVPRYIAVVLCPQVLIMAAVTPMLLLSSSQAVHQLIVQARAVGSC